MSYTGTIENGVVKLPPEADLADGTQVRIEEIGPRQDRNELTRRLREIAGQLEGLPEDWAEQHDHYLHGTPKRVRP
jgi:predicted DNA-binding antitoxin AbrB/MazE fold protein